MVRVRARVRFGVREGYGRVRVRVGLELELGLGLVHDAKATHDASHDASSNGEINQKPCKAGYMDIAYCEWLLPYANTCICV